MNLYTLLLTVAMFSIPWTVAGIIHPAAAGLRGSSRMKVFGIGAGAIVLASAILKELAVPGSKNNDIAAVIGIIWLLSCVIWPLAAWAMRRKEQAKGNPKPTPTAKPWEGAKPKPLTAEQRKPLNLPTRKPPAVAPKPNRTTRAIRTGWSIGEVAFTYMDADGEVSSRRVTVHSVTSVYLKGECHGRQAERTFRLDRIVGELIDCDTGELLNPKQWARQVNAGAKS